MVGIGLPRVRNRKTMLMTDTCYLPIAQVTRRGSQLLISPYTPFGLRNGRVRMC